jgi:hypothetical protein
MIVFVNVDVPHVSIREVAVAQQTSRLYRTSRTIARMLGTG